MSATSNSDQVFEDTLTPEQSKHLRYFSAAKRGQTTEIVDLLKEEGAFNPLTAVDEFGNSSLVSNHRLMMMKLIDFLPFSDDREKFHSDICVVMMVACDQFVALGCWCWSLGMRQVPRRNSQITTRCCE